VAGVPVAGVPVAAMDALAPTSAAGVAAALTRCEAALSLIVAGVVWARAWTHRRR
jgi:hypothetical protein